MPDKVFYPDADPESTSVDGYVEHEALAPPLFWADLIAAAGTSYDDSAIWNGIIVGIYASSTINKWRDLTRGIILFDTILLAGLTITSATLSLYCSGKGDYLGITPDVNIYSSNPISNTSLAAADYHSVGNTAFSTSKAYAGITVAAWNIFTLNASGISAINKTGISKFSVRNANYDVAGNAPGWISLKHSYIVFSSADEAAAPILTVTYASISDLSKDKTIVPSKVTLEAIRNIEVQFGGRFYVDKGGNAVYESRFHR